nr:histidine biosynthesis bifunctional protein hisie, chloroplastic [Quercus suber]
MGLPTTQGQKLVIIHQFLIQKNTNREEADELCRTLEENEDKSRTASEMADALYHAMVLLANEEVKIEDVMQVRRQRFSQEEADELYRTLEENEGKSRTASEMADVLYHAMVLLANEDVKIEDVMQVLRQRFSQSGVEEKRGRISQG